MNLTLARCAACAAVSLVGALAFLWVLVCLVVLGTALTLVAGAVWGVACVVGIVAPFVVGRR